MLAEAILQRAQGLISESFLDSLDERDYLALGRYGKAANPSRSGKAPASSCGRAASAAVPGTNTDTAA